MARQEHIIRPSDPGDFAATRWTLVLSAARGSQTPRAETAMAELCCIYWYPLYAFIRRQGYEAHTAEDLTQEFFAGLLAKQFLTNVDQRKGKFRSFLLASLKHFLANEYDRSQAWKRGGGQTVIPLDALDVETRYCMEPSHDLTPEKLFERQWALAVLKRVLVRLQTEFTSGGKTALFEALKGFLTGGQRETYATVGGGLGMSEGAVKAAVHRMRRRYRELMREEIAHTVTSPEEIEEEIRYLLRCL
jgi:RNA polymerase sigma-70 factor (ECF subfamily)